MIDLAAIETADPATRPAKLIAALEALERGELFAAGLQPAQGYGRLAAALSATVLDPASPWPEAALRRLAVYTPILNSLHGAAGFEPAPPALEPQSAGWERRLALLTLDTPTEIDLPGLFELEPELGLVKILGLLSTAPVLTARGAARREALLEMADRLRGRQAPATLTGVAVLSRAWMNCSYASGEAKHRLKPVLNEMLRTLLQRLDLQDRPGRGAAARAGKPTMVVIAEVIHSTHVQYRYFGQYLRQLRRDFRLVLVAPQPQIDAAAAALFDAVRGFQVDDNGRFLRTVRQIVDEEDPEAVFWPSVGMAKWGPLLANLRLAPVQITALGHSASTFIPAMDHYLTEAGYVADPRLFSERLALLPDESLRFERAPAYAPLAPELRASPEVLRIAAPSSGPKLNPAFMRLLEEVQRLAGRPVQFHIFPNATPVDVAALRATSAAALDAIIYPRLSAANYLSALNACDLVLSPFPFGGLHSVVDALRQGLPVVAMQGREPHSRTDALILRRVEAPGWLIAQNEAGYVAAALRLIRDDALRLEIGGRALSARIDETLFGDATTDLGDEVSLAVKAILAGE